MDETIQCFYVFTQDFAKNPPSVPRTGKFLGKAVVIPSSPRKMLVIVSIEGHNRGIELTIFDPIREPKPEGQSFACIFDEKRKVVAVSPDVRITDNDGKLLFLSEETWEIPYHLSVYEPHVEFETINKEIFSPKENG